MRKEKLMYLTPGLDDWKDLSSGKEDKKELNEYLLSAMQMQNIMVLAGSGTSLGEVGGPSMSKLWELCTTVNDVPNPKAVEVFHKLSYDITQTENQNIEVLLSQCEALAQIHKTDKDLNDYIDFCKSKILDACSFTTTTDKLFGHRLFVHRLSRRRVRDSRLKIFTTNYDLCFENAAGQQGIVTIDGFSFSKPRIYDPRFFDYDIVRRDGVNNDKLSYLEGVFHLYKLHGSVNWEMNSNGNIEEKNATPQGVRMIFPAKGKYQQSYIQPHLELMARYLSSLRQANTCLLICGFGFNDDHLSEPIISAIETNPYLKVIIVDNDAKKKLGDAESNKYWKDLKFKAGNGENIWFINATFQSFAKLIPDLRSLTPAEMLAKNIKTLAD